MKRILVLACMILFLGTFVSVEYATAADRIVNNKDGTVTDTKTGLMWADHDNGSNINWWGAKSYCEGYSGGGKSGWRMPTIDELRQLNSSGAYGSVIKKTSSFVWSSEIRGSDAAYFNFTLWPSGWGHQSKDGSYRTLPVRSGK
jgi:hypothetical protein